MPQLLNTSLTILSKKLMRLKLGTSLEIKTKLNPQLFIAILQSIQLTLLILPLLLTQQLICILKVVLLQLI